MRSFALSVAAGMMITNSGPARAIEPSAGPPQVWQLDWADSQCVISTGGLSTFLVSLWVLPGDPSPDLYVAGPSAELRTRAEKGTVIVSPANESFPALLIQRFGKNGTWVLQYADLKEKFPAAFASSTEVQLAGLKAPVRIRFKGAREAMAALKQCVDDKLNAWGIDAKTYESLRSPPLDPGHMNWFTADDYPADAQRADFQGNVVARVDVDAKGKVTGCTVVVGSGMDSLDKVACSKTLKSGKFIPAVGADGKPTAAARTISVKFRLEG